MKLLWADQMHKNEVTDRTILRYLPEIASNFSGRSQNSADMNLRVLYRLQVCTLFIFWDTMLIFVSIFRQTNILVRHERRHIDNL